MCLFVDKGGIFIVYTSESWLESEVDECVVSSSSNDTDSVIEAGCCSDIDEQGERFGCSYTNSTEEA